MNNDESVDLFIFYQKFVIERILLQGIDHINKRSVWRVAVYCFTVQEALKPDCNATYNFGI